MLHAPQTVNNCTIEMSLSFGSKDSCESKKSKQEQWAERLASFSPGLVVLSVSKPPKGEASFTGGCCGPAETAEVLGKDPFRVTQTPSDSESPKPSHSWKQAEHKESSISQTWLAPSCPWAFACSPGLAGALLWLRMTFPAFQGHTHCPGWGAVDCTMCLHPKQSISQAQSPDSPHLPVWKDLSSRWDPLPLLYARRGRQDKRTQKLWKTPPLIKGLFSFFNSNFKTNLIHHF